MTDGPTRYGFKWGPMVVERAMEYRGNHVFVVKTEAGQHLEVCVSPKGNSIRVWRNGKKMEVADEAEEG